MVATYCYSTLLAALLALPNPITAQVSGWLNPDSSQPDFSQSYHNTDAIVFSWEGLNQSLSDLWIASYDTTNPYALRIAANINITEPGNLPWTVTVNETEIDLEDRYRLHFIPTGLVYEASQADQFSSPGFLLLQRGEVGPGSSLTSTITATAPSSTASDEGSSTTPTSSASTTAAASSDDSGVSTEVKVGASVAAVVFLVLILGLAFWVMRLYRRVEAAKNHRSAGILPTSSGLEVMPTQETKSMAVRRISGLHEAHGDRHQPAELSTLKRQTKVYEMAG